MAQVSQWHADKASFNRFGDDLQSIILSYLSVDDQYRMLTASRWCMYNMFIYTNNVYIDQQWLSPINLIGDLRLVDTVMNVVQTRQYPAVRKLSFNLDHNCLRSVALFYNQCPNVQVLKLEGGHRKTMASAYMGEVLEFIRLRPSVESIRFNLMFNFSQIDLMNLFIRCYRNVATELGFTQGFTTNPAPIIESLHYFTKLEVLNIGYYNHQRSINWHVMQVLGQEVPLLRRLTIYRSQDKREDVLFNLDAIRQIFPKLDYYYVGAMVGGLWRDSAYQKHTMNDMLRPQTLRAPINFGDGFTVVYYSRKHSFIYYNQRVAEHRLVIPQDVKSMAYHFLYALYNREADTTNLLLHLKSMPNLTHLRVKSDCFTNRLLKFLVDKANNNPTVTYCFASRTVETVALYRNVWTNVAELKARLQLSGHN